MLNVCVCVKAVPDSDTVTFDAKKGTLLRNGKEMTVNPCDAVAVEAGVRLIKESGGSLSAVSMGPSDAGLRTALAMGAGDAYLLKSVKFAGADVPATAYTLAFFFKKYQKFDLIFCGKHSADGDTGQTGAMLAEFLGIPHVCGVSKILRAEDGILEVVQHLDDRELIIEIQMPCVVVIQNDYCIPGAPTLRGIIKSKRQEITVENEESLENMEITRCGLKGSASRVVKMFVPPNTREPEAVALNDTERLKTIFKEAGQDERKG